MYTSGTNKSSPAWKSYPLRRKSQAITDLVTENEVHTPTQDSVLSTLDTNSKDERNLEQNIDLPSTSSRPTLKSNPLRRKSEPNKEVNTEHFHDSLHKNMDVTEGEVVSNNVLSVHDPIMDDEKNTKHNGSINVPSSSSPVWKSYPLRKKAEADEKVEEQTEQASCPPKIDFSSTKANENEHLEQNITLPSTSSPATKIYPLRKKSEGKKELVIENVTESGLKDEAPVKEVTSSDVNSNMNLEEKGDIKQNIELPSSSKSNKSSQKATSSKRKSNSKASPQVSDLAVSAAKKPRAQKKTKPVVLNADGTPKRKRCQAKTVVARLEKMGIKAERVSCCVKSAMGKGHILLTGDKADLEQVIIEGQYEGDTVKVLLKDVLYQPDYAGMDYEDGCQDATAVCSCCDPDNYPCKCYVTRICEGNPQFDSGKFHNHCTECKCCGKCIDDYREAHCQKCNKHWFAGLSGFPCDNCQRKKQQHRFRYMLATGNLMGGMFESDDDDDDDDDIISMEEALAVK